MLPSYSSINGRRVFYNNTRRCRMPLSFHSCIIFRNDHLARMPLCFICVSRITYHQNIQITLVVSSPSTFVVCFIPNDIFSPCITSIQDNHTHIRKIRQYQLLQHRQLFLRAFGQTFYWSFHIVSLSVKPLHISAYPFLCIPPQSYEVV